MQGIGLRFLALAATIGALLTALLVFARPWYQNWGATDEEASATLPQELRSGSGTRQTRAIDVGAPADLVFAWVSQIGQDRAGFYSYELLQDLAGCEMPDVRRLDPELQRWSPGDRLWMYPRHKLDGLGYATLLHYEPGRALVFGTHSPQDTEGPSGTWAFIVSPAGPHASRLIARASGEGPHGLLGVAFNRTVFEPVHFAMEKRMLSGIAALAEGRSISEWRDHLQLCAWALSFASLVASAVLVLAGARWKRRLIAFAASGVVFAVVTLLQPSPLLGLALVAGLGVLLLGRRRETPPPAFLEPSIAKPSSPDPTRAAG